MTTSPNEQSNTIHADPSKDFFIDMLTRDISVIDCVLDLVDNAIDRAVELSGVKVMDLLEKEKLDKSIQGARVSIDFDESRFSIKDTCGGISVAEARDNVFRFGNSSERGASHGLSVYGIGMKRAFFKLGTRIEVHSRTANDFFDVTIDVADWKKRPQDWSFTFDKFGDRTNGEPVGTEILVSVLHPGIALRVKLDTFETELRNRIGSTYALFLRGGVVIETNGKPVEAKFPQLVGEPFKPVFSKKTFADVERLIIASLSPRPDRTPHGWYVFCNGRMVLEADKTALTGWGEGMPAFHSKYNHFVGLLYFESDDVRKLPWRTTKQGVEKESPVYQAALNEMKVQAKPILDYLTDMYPVDIEPEGVEERELLDSAKSVEVVTLSRSPSSFVAPARTKGQNKTVRVQYIRPRETIDKIAAQLGDKNMSASRVGEHTFDYFVANELQQ